MVLMIWRISEKMADLKKINFKALSVRLILNTLGTIISSFGVGCYYGCGLGTDPISVFVDGLHNISGMSYGTISTICNVIQAILIFLFIREYLGVGTLIGVLIAGPLIDVFETFIRVNFPLESISLGFQIAILIAGLFTTSIGYGLAIVSKVGVGCFQFLPIFLSKVTLIDLKYTQMFSDALFFFIGFMLGGVVGIGTLVGVFLTGYILSFTISKLEGKVDSLGKIILN